MINKISIEPILKYTSYFKLILLLSLVISTRLHGQTSTQINGNQTYQIEDTTKIKRIKIINTDVFEFKTDTTTKTTIRKFTGNVLFEHKGTDFYSNKAIQYMDSSIVVASGDVHIQKPDSFDVWADYLVYYSNKKFAKLRGNVIFQDSSAKLITDTLDYDMNKDVGYFWGGGKLITDSSTLSSEEGVYYHRKREAYFYKNVHLTNPDFDLYSDSMRYDTKERVAYFIAATKIVNGKDVIYCNSGFYDTKTNRAQFGGSTQMKSGSTKISADELNYDKNIGYGEATGNVIWEDTVEQITIIANYSEYWDSLSYVMATDDPLLIDITDGDTMYLSADTLITYKLPHPSTVVKIDKITPDSTMTDTTVSLPKDSVLIDVVSDSMTTSIDSFSAPIDTNKIIVDSIESKVDSIPASIDIDSVHVDSSIDTLKDTITYDVIIDTVTVLPGPPPDSIRIFHAYKNAKVLQGRMSGVCDSLYFSTGDSIFRFHQDPLVWVDTTQFSGDSMHIVLKNKVLDRILIYKNAMIIHENMPTIYDQTKGKEVEGFFKDEKMTKMEIKGNGESIYFIKDDSSAFVGGNKSICSRMVITMKPGENDVDYITFITKPEATFTPFRMINLASYKLEGFSWQFEKKPKNVDDIVRYRPLYEYFLQYLGKGKDIEPKEDEVISSTKEKLKVEEEEEEEEEVIPNKIIQLKKD
ncbi:MAG: OstA-like protein [Chitinophagales bacterium]